MLTLTVKHAGHFNLHGATTPLSSFTGRHLVACAPLLRLRLYLLRSAVPATSYGAEEVLSDEAFLDRFGRWNGPFAEGTLFSIWTNTPGRAHGP